MSDILPNRESEQASYSKKAFTARVPIIRPETTSDLYYYSGENIGDRDIPGVVYIPENHKSRNIVTIVPGIGTDYTNELVVDIASRLASEGNTVYGLGDVTKDTPVFDWQYNVVDSIREMRKKFNIAENISDVIIGVSLGGTVALGIDQNSEVRLAKVIMLASPSDPWRFVESSYLQKRIRDVPEKVAFDTVVHFGARNVPIRVKDYSVRQYGDEVTRPSRIGKIVSGRPEEAFIGINDGPVFYIVSEDEKIAQGTGETLSTTLSKSKRKYEIFRLKATEQLTDRQHHNFEGSLRTPLLDAVSRIVKK